MPTEKPTSVVCASGDGRFAPYWIVRGGAVVPVCVECWRKVNDPVRKVKEVAR